MAEFKVEVKEIEDITEHPNADRLEIAHIGGTEYQSCVNIGQYKPGDLAAYIPVQSMVPEDVQEELGVKGYLAGSSGKRVKTIRLRGELSQGLLHPAKEDWEKGQDVTEELGIEKYQPPIPTQMSGHVYGSQRACCIKYDVENFRNYPDALEEGEEVFFTEKLHGTFAQMGLVTPDLADLEYGPFVVGSKGLLGKCQPFKPEADANENNLYLRTADQYDVRSKLEKAREDFDDCVFVLGEVFGKTVQDLSYGADAQDNEMGFRVFDAYVGPYLQGRYLNHSELDEFCQEYGLDRVPVLYEGPFSKEVMKEYTDGHETLTGDQKHIREGIVVRPVEERWNSSLGRVQLKSVSEDYLTRKGGTERQ